MTGTALVCGRLVHRALLRMLSSLPSPEPFVGMLPPTTNCRGNVLVSDPQDSVGPIISVPIIDVNEFSREYRPEYYLLFSNVRVYVRNRRYRRRAWYEVESLDHRTLCEAPHHDRGEAQGRGQNHW
jgi:hypothetical protein